MEAKIQQRIAELEQVERDVTVQVQIVRTVLAELRALLAPAPPAADQTFAQGDTHAIPANS